MTNAELFETIDNYLMGLHRIDIYSPYDEYSKGWNDALEAATKVISTLESEKPVPADLEEAADEYEKQVIEETKCHHNALTYAEGYEDALLLIPDAFIAGAKWQKEQYHFFNEAWAENIPNDLDKAARKAAIPTEIIDVDEEHLYEYPYLPIAEQKFKEGAKWQEEQDLKYISEIYRNGYNLCKEQMMKEAVEGVIIDSGFDDGIAFVTMNIPDRRYDRGDKVRLIIVKDKLNNF